MAMTAPPVPMRSMRFKCDAHPQGRCWLREHVARLGVFDDCFPGRIGLTDVDGMVERHGCLLLVELKRPGATLPNGQRIVFERATRRMGSAFQPVVIWGENDFIGPLRWQRWVSGRSRGPEDVSLDSIRDHFRRWFAWADRHPL